MSDDLFSQEHPVNLHLSTKGCHFPYEVFKANGFTGEWVETVNGDDELFRLLGQNNFMYTKDGRYCVCGEDVPMYLSRITQLPPTIGARDVTDIVLGFRKKVLQKQMEEQVMEDQEKEDMLAEEMKRHQQQDDRERWARENP